MALDPEASAARVEVVLLRPSARLPRRQSDHASGFDLGACLDDGPLEVGLEPVLVPTGLAIAVPPGLDAQVRPRSGLSARGVIAVLGTLDADYRGELFVTMYALPHAAPYQVHDGDRIAQLVIGTLAPVRWEPVTSLDATGRGTGGHGSTGRR